MKILKQIFTAFNWIVAIMLLILSSAVEEVTWTQIILCAICGAYLCCAMLISENLKKRKKALH